MFIIRLGMVMMHFGGGMVLLDKTSTLVDFAAGISVTTTLVALIANVSQEDQAIATAGKSLSVNHDCMLTNSSFSELSLP